MHLIETQQQLNTTYYMRAITTRGLYISYPIFHCGLYCKLVGVTDNLCTKQGEFFTFWV